MRRLSWRDKPNAAVTPNRGRGPGTGEKDVSVAIANFTVAEAVAVPSVKEPGALRSWRLPITSAMEES
jgi:hypothetical protein